MKEIKNEKIIFSNLLFFHFLLQMILLVIITNP